MTSIEKTGSDPIDDNILIDYIEFSDNALMRGDSRSPPNLGGAPAEIMPMRSEPFVYNHDPKIDQ